MSALCHGQKEQNIHQRSLQQENCQTHTPAAMAVCRRLQHLLGLVGTMFLIILSFYQWDMFQEKRAERTYQMQQLRKQLLREMCDGDQTTFSGGKHSFEDLSNAELKNLVVDDNHGVIYCYIPKVACTNWKRVMLVLNKSEPYQDPMSISGELVHNTNVLTQLTSFPRTEMKAKLKHYTKFLFVRDPFVRLISAYRDKFQKHNQYYYDYFARHMLRLYGNNPNPPQTVEKAFASGTLPSFYNFIQYLLDPRTESTGPFEPHWRQMHRLCHPCLIQYDFIGHQESLQEDAKQLLSILKLEDVIKFPPSYENMTASNSVRDWFRTVPLEDRRKLYKLYEADFMLFGYRKPDELLGD